MCFWSDFTNQHKLAVLSTKLAFLLKLEVNQIKNILFNFLQMRAADLIFQEPTNARPQSKTLNLSEMKQLERRIRRNLSMVVMETLKYLSNKNKCL